MLDYGGYAVSDGIRGRHVMDNSCGDGSFLKEVVRRYLSSCAGAPLNEIKNELETYIHGIEIDQEECGKCRESLSAIAEEYGVTNVEWDLKCANSLTVDEYDGKMDFVFGNPPYVRTRNLDDNEFRKFSFAEKGMADIYLAFYELGLRMKNETGTMCYIAPSSWIYSTSGKSMRKWIMDTKALSRVVDFEDIQVFENAQTYVMITLFDGEPHTHIQYDKYDGEDKKFKTVSTLKYDNIFINGKIFFAGKEGLDVIRKIEAAPFGSIRVKNGYATLADNIFIDNLPELSDYTIDVVKSSTGKWKKCLFPYDKNLNPVPLGAIKQTAEDVYRYIMDNEEALRKRTYDRNRGGYWHLIGRSQGLCDTYRRKIAVNSYLRTPSDIKLNEANPGQGVYGGLYILTDKGVDEILRVLKTETFIGYIKSLRKYKSGGYYTYSASDLEKYLNFIFSGEK